MFQRVQKTSDWIFNLLTSDDNKRGETAKHHFHIMSWCSSHFKKINMYIHEYKYSVLHLHTIKITKPSVGFSQFQLKPMQTNITAFEFVV